MTTDDTPRTSYDVVVVGGRIAGSLSAILLARAGYRVLVADRSRFPSSTLSTHFFRGDGLIRVLDEANVLDAVLALGSPKLTGEHTYGNGEAAGTIGPPQSPGQAGYCLSVRREPLDATLLDCARDLGVEIRTSTFASRVLATNGRAVGVELSDGTLAMAPLVVGADGRRSLVAAQVGAGDRKRYPGRRALYYRYVRGMPGPTGGTADAAEFSQIGDELAYVFPSDQDLTCVALSVNLIEYERIRHDTRRHFDTLLRRHTGLWDRYSASAPDGRLYGSAPQDDFVRQAAGPGWALVGDSGIHQDPWSGLGMDSAGLSAAMLARSVVEAGGPDAADRWITSYEQSRDAVLIDWFDETVAGAADLTSLLA